MLGCGTDGTKLTYKAYGSGVSDCTGASTGDGTLDF